MEEQPTQPKKSNKAILIAVIIVVVVGAAVAVYFTTQGEDENTNTTTTNTPSTDTITNTISETRYQGDGFSLLQPTGWTQSHITGTLVSFHNNDEAYAEGSAAANINFKSYVAVTFDNTNDMTLAEINDLAIRNVEAAIPSVNIIDTTDETVNGVPSKFNTMQMFQQDVDYTVLVTIHLADNKYYSISFNTTTEKWPEYKDEFFRIARSFKIE